MKTVYKLCYIKDNDYISVCRNCVFPEKFRVYYELNKVIKPKVSGTKLFVFDSLKNAKHFASTLFCNQSRYVILECSTPKVWKPKYLSDIFHIAKFWSLKKNHKKIPYTITYGEDIPTGTLCCNELTPLKVVAGRDAIIKE